MEFKMVFTKQISISLKFINYHIVHLTTFKSIKP